MRKARVLFIIYMFAGAASLFSMFALQVPDLAARLVRVNQEGERDLDMMANVSVFTRAAVDYEEQVNAPRLQEMQRSLDNAPNSGRHETGVVLLGDSFIDGNFRSILSKKHGIPNRYYKMKGDMTIDRLRSAKADKSLKAGYLLYESVDRLILFRFGIKDDGVDADDPNILDASFGNNGGEWKYKLVDPEGLEYLVTHNPLGYYLLGLRNTFRMFAFGEISPNTPVYSTDPPVLFYHKSVSFNIRRIPNDKIKLLADWMRDYSKFIEESAGLKMVYMPVPSKFTVYGFGHDEYDLNMDEELTYNEFLPRLYKELDRRGVEYIDLYHDFVNTDEMLYYPTGTHWNITGKKIALEKLNNWYEQQERVSATTPE